MHLIRVFLFIVFFLVTTNAAIVRILEVDSIKQISRVSNVTQKEYSALVSFYIESNGATWNNNKYWLDPSYSPCLWYGVTCDQTGMHIATLGMFFDLHWQLFLPYLII